MCKLFVAVALLAIAVYAAPPAPPTADEVKAQLVAAGISDKAAQGIVDVAEKYKTQLEEAKGNPENAKKAFEAIKSDTETYIKTQSEADQKAYEAFVEQKKKEFEGHHTTPTH
ncbi:hypothetical protein GCK72_018039 [Caenorhabditis remanei]|nr:hypothetical protein GCK72_018039 [Caenorhabditis remanei]KAF1751485.1 hypothetical protein GCK72_018039 [Caenorhabditis remanei]